MRERDYETGDDPPEVGPRRRRREPEPRVEYISVNRSDRRSFDPALSCFLYVLTAAVLLLCILPAGLFAVGHFMQVQEARKQAEREARERLRVEEDRAAYERDIRAKLDAATRPAPSAGPRKAAIVEEEEPVRPAPRKR